MKLEIAPVAKSEMLIRKPVSEVFEAFVDPSITSRFWFTKGSERLEPGREVRWDWEMYKFSLQVKVREVEKDKRIVVEWGNYDDASTIEWTFTARPENTTFVSITNSGFTSTGDERVRRRLTQPRGSRSFSQGGAAKLGFLFQTRTGYPPGKASTAATRRVFRVSQEGVSSHCSSPHFTSCDTRVDRVVSLPARTF